MQPTTNGTEEFSPYQKLIVAILALLQFTVVLDFMVLSPLGDILMKSLKMNPADFGLVVSSYAFSAKPGEQRSDYCPSIERSILF